METSSKPVLVVSGIYIPGYSFTRVFESLLEPLAARYTIHWLGIAYKGEIEQKRFYTLYPCNKNGGDIYGAYGAAALALELKATAVLLLNDFYLLRNYEYAWQSLKEKGIRLAAYVPLDGLVTDVNMMQECFFLDELVLYHKAVMKDIQQAINKYQQQSGNIPAKLPRLSYRYHGVDTHTFHPVSDAKRLVLKKQLFKLPDAEQAIFLLNGNRYTERKDLVSTISGFAKAYPQFQQPAYLVLHTPNMEPQKRLELVSLIDNSGVAHRILLNPLGEEYISDAQLAQLYQACDVGINTSFGEGWGLISLEHAACGAAQVVPGHSAPGELWPGTAIVVPAPQSIQLSSNPFLMHRVDTDHLASSLVSLVNDPSMLHTVTERCLQFARQPEFDWKNIGEEWREIIGL